MDNNNMNKFNGHEAYIISAAVDSYVIRMNESIKQAEAEGKRPIFTVDYFPQLAKDIKTKLNLNTLKYDGNME
tara:strand:+ start:275 stop:493 length:219 start_codon:yes stop_codon:yes gene_type:complete